MAWRDPKILDISVLSTTVKKLNESQPSMGWTTSFDDNTRHTPCTAPQMCGFFVCLSINYCCVAKNSEQKLMIMSAYIISA